MTEEMPVGLRFAVLARAIRKQIDDSIRAEDLTGAQFFVLHELRRLELSGAAEVNQKDLEAASRVTHPTMTDMLRRLERKGYVVCRRSETDRRFKCVASTEKAQGLKQRIDETDRRAFEALCENLNSEERETLLAITGRMMGSAEKLLGKGCEDSCDQNTCQKPAGV